MRWKNKGKNTEEKEWKYGGGVKSHIKVIGYFPNKCKILSSVLGTHNKRGCWIKEEYHI